jgi:hypothetical protein
MRALSATFMKDLLADDGVLHPLLERIKQDDTLMLAIREDYINIYYRGGNILKVEEAKKKNVAPYYKSSFEKSYNESEVAKLELPNKISTKNDAIAWVDAFQELKRIMDCYFLKHNNLEREFQQLVARENNFLIKSSEREYYVTDFEYSDHRRAKGRFDMLALHRLDSPKEGKMADVFRPVLIEMKYGDNALNGKSGLIKHLEDIDSFIAEKSRYQTLVKTLESQYNQLDELGLVRFDKNAPKNWKNITVSSDEKPEVILILANHNPSHEDLGKILNNSENKPKFDVWAKSSNFDLRFHVSSFSGYALYAKCMVTLEEFRKMVKI